MSVANCPHCTAPVPPAFASMPVCTICGGDLSAAPSAPVWASIDIKTDNTRTCPKCGDKVKSILALECPNCHSDLAPAGQAVADIEKEKAEFEEMVKSSNKKVETQPIKEETKKEELPPPTLKSKTSSSDVKSYSETKKEQKKEKPEEIKSLKSKKKKKEGFFVKLLRMLGLKKD